MSASDGKGGGDGFYTSLPVFDMFARLTDQTIYRPLPGDWKVGVADIVQSTAAIESGRYKVVNTAAASVIVALSNTLKTEFPFVFGGDGASFAVPAGQAAQARSVMADVAAWVRDEFAMELRVAMVSVAELRQQGADVRIARFAPSPDVAYAMFTGGGLALAEQRMKAGDYAIPPAPAGSRPDLTGLTCRFDEIRADSGVILSLIVMPSGGDAAAFDTLVSSILSAAEATADAGQPKPRRMPGWPPAGFQLELKTQASTGVGMRIKLLARTLFSYLVFKSGRSIGSFDPKRYRRQLVANTDFRKFDDGLRMTLDCTTELADRIEGLLEAARRDRVAVYGTHRQEAALMTCFVPSPTRADHVHFIDGAMGGYAAAARALKNQAMKEVV
jgi:hypothetical protein